jgi:hypothetical protein
MRSQGTAAGATSGRPDTGDRIGRGSGRAVPRAAVAHRELSVTSQDPPSVARGAGIPSTRRLACRGAPLVRIGREHPSRRSWRRDAGPRGGRSRESTPRPRTRTARSALRPAPGAARPRSDPTRSMGSAPALGIWASRSPCVTAMRITRTCSWTPVAAGSGPTGRRSASAAVPMTSRPSHVGRGWYRPGARTTSAFRALHRASRLPARTPWRRPPPSQEPPPTALRTTPNPATCAGCRPSTSRASDVPC